MNIARYPLSARQLRSVMRPWWSLWTSWCLVAVCALLFGGAAPLADALREQPLYRASVTVSITLATTGSGTNNSALKTKLVPSYAQLAISRPVLAAVAAMHPGMTTDMLAQEVSVSTTVSAGTFRIIVLDPAATRASLLAYEVASEAATQAQRTLQQQYAVDEQQVRQDLRSTNEQIASDTATLDAVTTPLDPRRKAAIQSQLDSLRQRLAADLWALSHIEIARSNAPRVLQLQAVGKEQEVRTSVSFTTGGIAALGGAGIGMVLALALASRRQRIRGSQDVELLLGCPVLAVMSLSESTTEVPSALSLSEEIASAIPRALFVTSVRSPSRTGIVAQNFALGLAGMGSKTLLVDTDLRRACSSRSLSWMGVPAEPGLSDAVLAAAERRVTPLTYLAGMILEPAPSIPAARAIRVMPAGTPAPNPLGVLRSTAMGTVYQHLLAYGADRVVFRGHSLLDSAEAPFLSGQMDAVVLAVDPRRLRRADLLAAADVLRASQAHVVGCVLVSNTSRPRWNARAHASNGERPL